MGMVISWDINPVWCLGLLNWAFCRIAEDGYWNVEQGVLQNMSFSCLPETAGYRDNDEMSANTNSEYHWFAEKVNGYAICLEPTSSGFSEYANGLAVFTFHVLRTFIWRCFLLPYTEIFTFLSFWSCCPHKSNDNTCRVCLIYRHSFLVYIIC
jgi:hypothetical protein